MTQLEQVTKLVDATEEQTVRLATDIWNYAELSYAEVRSAAALLGVPLLLTILKWISNARKRKTNETVEL